MSTPAHSPDRRGVPPPPGGHALRIDPDAPRPVPAVHSPPSLPIVEETSAGGLVVDVVDGLTSAAIIARRNRGGRLEWCLPKGHLEGAETPEEAAVREIAEETGISGAVETSLGVIDYWFTGDDRRVHKVVHHFLLRATGGHLTVEGDPDGEAEDVAWVPLTELVGRLSYPNERRMAAVAGEVLRGRRAAMLIRGTVTHAVVSTRPAPRAAQRPAPRPAPPQPRNTTDHP